MNSTNQTEQNQHLQAALNYAAMGYPVFPCQADGKQPATEHGLKDASTDPKQLARWFGDGRFNIGLRTDGLCVVDVDGQDNPFLSTTPKDRLQTLGATPMQRTPGGGFHFPFRQNGTPIKNSQSKVSTKVDIRADGGYIVVAPSTVNGKAYSWTRPLVPRDQLPIVADWIETAATATKQAKGAAGPARAELMERCWRYVQQMPDAISGEGGHGATFAAACVCFRFGLTDLEAGEILRRFNAIKTGTEQWTGQELDHKLQDARQTVTAAGEFNSLRDKRPAKRKTKKTGGGTSVSASEVLQDLRTIANGVTIGDGEKLLFTIAETISHIEKKAGAWPRRVGQDLFIHDDQHGLSFLTTPASLFGWLSRVVGRVEWCKGVGAVSQQEVFCELRRTAQNYANIESLPHEPPMAGHYYACKEIQPGDGKSLKWLLHRFNPATPLDADLILAAFLTPLWGGRPGCRPCFVITSDDGRGAGKSTLAEIIGALYGGMLQFSHHDDIGTIKTRLLCSDALTKRVALLDNVKDSRFSWAELEAMITATSIGGHKMYVGEATRPNSLTWFVTLNGAALSTDMAQRSIIVNVKKPERTATWEEDTRRFIDEHQREIIADLIGVLRGPATAIASYSRWASWERDVLQRLPEPADAQRTILERQSVVDVELEEATLIEDAFAGQLAHFGYDVETERVFIASHTAAKWISWATNKPSLSVVAASRLLSQLAKEQRLRRLSVSTGRSWGRGFLWTGERSDGTHISVDLQERIREGRSQDA